MKRNYVGQANSDGWSAWNRQDGNGLGKHIMRNASMGGWEAMGKGGDGKGGIRVLWGNGPEDGMRQWSGELQGSPWPRRTPYFTQVLGGSVLLQNIYETASDI